MLSEWQLRVEIHNPAMNAQCARWVMWTSSLHTLSFAGAVATPTWKASSILQSHPTFAGCALGFPVLLPGEFAACFSVFVLRTSQYLQRLTSPLAQCQPVKINKTKKIQKWPVRPLLLRSIVQHHQTISLAVFTFRGPTGTVKLDHLTCSFE